MNALFNMEGSLMRGLTKLADLIILNILTWICCVPIVTIGASFTALHYVCLKMVRDEDCYIVKDYFKSFKENLKQSTAIWLILLLGFGVVAADILVMYYADVVFPFIIRTIILVVGLFTLCTMLYAFPMQAKFVNPVSKTIKNAFKASILQFPKTLVMIALLFVAPLLIIFLGNMIPIAIMFCFSAHAYVSALMYNKFFKKMEDKYLEACAGEGAAADMAEDAEDERIFHDELDEMYSSEAENSK